MLKIKINNKNIIYNSPVKYSYRCTNIKKHNLNFLVTVKLNKNFIFINNIWHFKLLKIKIMPFFRHLTKKQYLFGLFTVNAPSYFPIVETAAQKCNGVAVGNWINGAISAKVLPRFLEKKTNGTDLTYDKTKSFVNNIKVPNLLITPFSKESKSAISEARSRKVVSFGGTQFEKFSFILPDYFILGAGLNYKFAFQFCLLISFFVSLQNNKYQTFLIQKKGFYENYLLLLKNLFLKKKIKKNKLKKTKKIDKTTKKKKRLARVKKFCFAEDKKHKKKRGKNKLKNLLNLFNRFRKIKIFYKNLYLFWHIDWAPDKFYYLKYWNRRNRFRKKLKKYQFFFGSTDTLIRIKIKKIQKLILKKVKKKLFNKKSCFKQNRKMPKTFLK